MPIHPSAVIASEARIADDVVIGPHVVIDGDVHLEPGCRLDAGVVLYGPLAVGARTVIHAHAVLGGVPQDRAFHGEDSFVEIGEDCIIREGTTIHRGTQPGSRTTIANRCFLMTNCHVGHNCLLDDDVTLISGCLLGGHVNVGRGAVISGNAAVHQFVRVGELAMISGLAKVVQDVPPFLMTDRDGALVGVNRVGLLRSGLNSEERTEIRTAYRILYRSGLTRLAALAQLKEVVKTPAGERLTKFLSEDSKRGVAPDANFQRQKFVGGLDAADPLSVPRQPEPTP